MLIASLKSPLERFEDHLREEQLSRTEDIQLENRAQGHLEAGELEQALDCIRALDKVHTFRQRIVGLSCPGEDTLHALCCRAAIKYAHQGDFGLALDLIPAEGKAVFRQLILELIAWECMQRLQLMKMHFPDSIQNMIIGYWINVSDHDYGIKKSLADKLTMVWQITQSLINDWSFQISIGRSKTFNFKNHGHHSDNFFTLFALMQD